MRIALAQVDPTMGDFQGNLRKIGNLVEDAKKNHADIVAFPELAVSGYPPQDLLYEHSFVKANKAAVEELAGKTDGIVVIVGFVDFDEEWHLYNSAALIRNHEVMAVVHKTLLPTYDVFDEARYFHPNSRESIAPVLVEVGKASIKLGVEICEDLWDHDYDTKVTDILAERGAQLVINISASPFYVGKRFEREALLKEKAMKNKIPMFLVNLVGGQDELVFDGQSLVVDATGETVAAGAPFKEDLLLVDFYPGKRISKKTALPEYDKDEEILNCLVLGIRDYFLKTGFQRAVLGLSGGIDSSVTACIAVEALGSKNVIGFSMPSKFSSSHSRTDAEQLSSESGHTFGQVPNSRHSGLISPYSRASLE